MNEQFLSWKLSGAYIAIYGILACFYPFLTYYFQTRGLSYTEMGICFALVSLTSVIVQPVWGFIADKYANKRTILLLTMCMCSLVIYALVIASSFYLVMAGIFLVILFQSPLVPVADAYCYAIIKASGRLQYGKIRLMGSLGYAVVALILGWIVKYFGIESSYIVYSISCLLGIGLIYSIHFQDRSTRKQVHMTDVMSLLNKKVILLLLAVAVTNISISSNSSYIAILIEKTDGAAAELGLLWFLVAISELPAFYFGGKLLKRYGELNLFILGLLLFALRFALQSLCTWYIPVLIIQLMQGVTYTFFLIASLEYLNRISPSKVKTVAMTLHAAAIAIGGIIGNLGGGVLLEYISIFVFYKVLAVNCIVGISFLLVLKRTDAV